MERWSVEDEEVLLATPRGLTVSQQTIRLPNNERIPDFLQVRMPNFVTIVGVTLDQHVLVLHQYKHGVGEVGLTLPGGGIEGSEDPISAAKRELLEETGYASERWAELGSFVLNGNQHIARSHVFLATDCFFVTQPQPGDLEEMKLLLMPWQETKICIKENKFPIISHTAALGLAALQDI